MSEAWIGVAVVGGAITVIALLALLARRIRRRGTAGAALGAAMAAYDEAMRPSEYEAFIEMQAQSERVVPAPSPSDR